MTDPAVESGPAEPRSDAGESPGAVALQSLFRLARLGALHATDNQAILQALPQGLAALRNACASNGQLTVAFAGDAVWVNERLLKAKRQAYEVCQQVGRMLARLGFNQLRVEEGITEDDLKRLLLALNATSTTLLPEAGAVSLRRVEVRLPTAMSGADVPVEQSVRLYTSGVVLTQRLIDEVRQGRYELFRHVKRMGHRLVLRAEGNPETLREIVMRRVARREEASRAMHTAILAVLAALRVTDDRRVLLRVVTSALAMDLGRPRAAGLTGAGRAKQLRLGLELTEPQKDRLPEATAYVFLSVGSQTAEALSRACVLYEAQALPRRDSLGAPHGGRWPGSLEAGLISTARRLVDVVANGAITAPLSLAQAAQALEPKLPTALEKRCLELIVQGADLVLEGSSVELESGWMGQVTRVSDDNLRNRQPKVQLLRAPAGAEAGATGETVDLALRGPHGSVRRVVSVPRRD